MSLTRKDFLIISAKAVLIAGIGPLLSGCAKFLNKQEEEEKSSLRITERGKPPSKEAKEKVAASDIASVKGNNIAEMVRAGIDKLGGISSFVKPGNKVLIKPNILYGQKPEYAATTNPQVIAALVTLCREAGAAEVVVADRPTSSPTEAYRISGIGEACQKAGGKIKVLTDRHFVSKDIPEGSDRILAVGGYGRSCQEFQYRNRSGRTLSIGPSL